ncbi:MAG: alkaline phosphatase D family protein, partial [Planctomycetota bacterium]
MTKPSHSTETDTPASTTRLGRRGMLQISAAASGVAASMPLASPTRAAVDAEIASEKSSTQTAATNKDSLIEFSKTPDRVFISGNTWANPMEDWQLESGRAVCMSGGAKRNLHSLIHEVDQNGDLHLAVDIQRVQKRKFDQVGFRVGIQSDIKDYRANCFTHRGLDAGIVGNDAAAGKKLFIGPKSIDVDVSLDQPLRLDLQASVGDAESLVTLKLLQASGDVVGEVQHRVAGSRLLGNVALVQHFGRGDAKFGAGSFAFGDWTLAGSAISVRPERAFGPLLWTMYTLSDSRSTDGMMLNLTALTGPLGQQDSREIELEFQRDGKWVRHGVAELDPDAFTATFRIANWDATTSIPFRCVFRQRDREGNHAETFYREGTIRAEPKDRPLRLGALTCQNDYAFPYAPVADNLVKVDPDLLYFSGDQLYEGHGGYGIIRRPADRAILNYLRKFYQFGWAFGHAMADRPTLCIPDDHDVFQGNIWGEGGRAMEVSKGGASSKGGYIEPAKMVNVVHRTNTSHHPAPFDPQPCQQDISVYYGTLLWGGVSFAILGDRQWKSGPERVETGSGRADHVIDHDFDTSVLDQPGLDLLGERQEAFLKQWSRDWDGHTMKVLLSQTVFAGVATHHGGYNGYLKGDLDSGSWPQSA